MRKFFISGGILLVLILFIISLYIPPTYNKKSLSLIERLKCVFTPESIKAKATESYVQKISENKVWETFRLRYDGLKLLFELIYKN